jgi:hypothetical protein
MATGLQNDTGHMTKVTAAAIAQGLRVKITTSNTWDIAAATDLGVGIAEFAAASGGELTVKLWNAPGTFLVKCNAAVTAGAALFAIAGGLFDDAGGSTAIVPGLVALEAATAQNDLIEAALSNVGT